MKQTILIFCLVCAGCGDEPDPAYVVDGGGDDNNNATDADSDTDTDSDTDSDTDADSDTDSDTDTALTCGEMGRPVAGFCWYRSGVGRHCLEACEDNGGYNQATRTYAGSEGTNINCELVGAAFGFDSIVSNQHAGGIGCAVISTALIRDPDPTLESATNDGISAARFCACNQ